MDVDTDTVRLTMSRAGVGSEEGGEKAVFRKWQGEADVDTTNLTALTDG